MIYLSPGKYLHPYYCNYAAMPDSVKNAHKQYILRIESTYTVCADTDSGCDRVAERTDYRVLLPNNIIMDGDKPMGVYIELRYYYRVSKKRPNVLVLPFKDGARHYQNETDMIYTLIPYDPEQSYESETYIR